MRRDIVWERLDQPGLEHLSLDIRPDGIDADGLVLVDPGEGVVAKLRYAVRCDDRWRTTSAAFAVDLGNDHRTVEVKRDGGDGWIVDGGRRADLDGCIDIDITATPFTNTLPIRQLDLRPEEARRLRVVYVGVPDLSVLPADQEYTRLDPASPPGRFRYRGLSTGFVAEIAVDGDGVVTDYPGLWRRRGQG